MCKQKLFRFCFTFRVLHSYDWTSKNIRYSSYSFLFLYMVQKWKKHLPPFLSFFLLLSYSLSLERRIFHYKKKTQQYVFILWIPNKLIRCKYKVVNLKPKRSTIAIFIIIIILLLLLLLFHVRVHKRKERSLLKGISRNNTARSVASSYLNNLFNVQLLWFCVLAFIDDVL